MAQTPNFDITEVAANQNQKETTINTGFVELEAALSNFLAIAMPDADYTLSTGEGGQALGNVAPLVSADTAAKHQSWDAFNNITGAITNAAGAASGFKLPGCWIAEAIYGVEDPRTHLIRAWLNGPFRETGFGDWIMRLYLTIGRPVAWLVKRSSVLRKAFKPLFDLALRKAVTIPARHARSVPPQAE